MLLPDFQIRNVGCPLITPRPFDLFHPVKGQVFHVHTYACVTSAVRPGLPSSRFVLANFRKQGFGPFDLCDASEEI